MFRRDNRETKEKSGEDMYVFPPISGMSSSEIDNEIKVRVQALQDSGLLPRVEEVKETAEDKQKKLVSNVESSIRKLKDVSLKRHDFVPKFFIKRRS